MSLILAINSGSSSLKFGLFTEQGGDEQAVVRGNADAIGSKGSKLDFFDRDQKVLLSEQHPFASQKEALTQITKKLSALNFETPVAIGHRIVHGGPHLVAHCRINDQVLDTLNRAVHFAPLHIPPAIDLVRHTEGLFPGIPQFACFDTAFHQTMPEAAYRFAIPEKYYAQGIRRYGFHGLSYASILHALGRGLPSKVVVAHLGSGASIVAIANGKSVDTSMGLTPTGGVPMGTRTGDLDPGVSLFLMRNQSIDADTLEYLLNHESGLVALGGTNDMRTLSANADNGDAGAQLAIEIFCRSIAKTIGSYAAVLGGLDLIVFAGGIGEHSFQVRDNICSRLNFLDAILDSARNRHAAQRISSNTSRVDIRIIASEEERQIARHCRSMLTEKS
ncbi:MAG TPA: acetate/propionate family kinase [Alloacidobacterium sp.]|nr:acetate/propionate family kinase [Alloacidobacterium sp.]